MHPSHKSDDLYKRYFALPGACITASCVKLSYDTVEIAAAISIAVPAAAALETAQLPTAVAKEDDEGTGRTNGSKHNGEQKESQTKTSKRP